MLERILDRARANPHIATLSRFCDITVRIDSGDESLALRIAPDGVAAVPDGAAQAADLVLTASPEAWAALFGVTPAPGYQTLSAMRRVGHLQVDGAQLAYYQNLLLLELLFSLDTASDAVAEPAGAPYLEPVIGRYMHLDIDGRPHRLYFEEAGEGIPLLCLHTAGADGRQYRAILNDKEITRRFRVIAFDLPWHGKSSPPAGFGAETYRLTTESYVETVMAVSEALALEQPVIMGCSIGGRAVLHLALRHGDRFRAAVGLQSALYAENAVLDEADLMPLDRGDVHGGRLAGASMASLTAPQSPEAERWETLWHYMQGGPGVFLGDLHYYFVDGDLRNTALDGLAAGDCPIYLLTGEYDYSATPEMTRDLARRIDAAHCEIMREMGHFPMSENPEKFREYLLPVLGRIAADA